MKKLLLGLSCLFTVGTAVGITSCAGSGSDVDNIKEIDMGDFNNAGGTVTENEKEMTIRIGSIRMTQHSHNGAFWLTKNELKELFDFWVNDVMHGPEIAFLDGIDIDYNDSGGTAASHGFYVRSTGHLRLVYGMFDGKGMTGREKITNFKYTLAHEYGHHLTIMYFKNLMTRLDNKEVGGDKFSNTAVTEYLAKRGLDQNSLFKWLTLQNGGKPSYVTDSQHPFSTSGRSSITHKDYATSKYWISLKEWLTRDFTMMTIADPLNFADTFIKVGFWNTAKVDQDIRKFFESAEGGHGGDAAFYKAIFSDFRTFYKNLIGFDKEISVLYQKKPTQNSRVSSIGGFTSTKHDYLVSVVGGKVVGKVKIHYGDSLSSTAFKDSNTETPTITSSDHAYVSDFFSPNTFADGGELRFADDANSDGQITIGETVVASSSGTYKMLANQDGKTYYAADPLHSQEGRAKGSITASGGKYTYSQSEIGGI